jgi:hypothetical protein
LADGTGPEPDPLEPPLQAAADAANAATASKAGTRRPAWRNIDDDVFVIILIAFLPR